MRHAIVSIVLISLFAIAGCNSKQGYVARGNKLYEQGKYVEASLNYRKAIQKDPQYGEAYYRLGLSAIKQNDARQAFDGLFRATQLLPNRIDVKEKFADVCLLYYLGDPRHSQSYYTLLTQISVDLLAKNPNSFKAWEIKGYLAHSDRKPQEAIAYFRRALQIDPSDPAVSGELAQNLLRNGESREAEKVALDLTTRQKSYGPIYDFLYELYTTTGRAVQAENILNAKVNNNPANSGYLVQLAAHYARVRKQTEMKAALERLLDDPKDFPQGSLLVGDFYMRLGDYGEAIREYEQGAKNTPKEKILYQKRTANALLAQGKNEAAFRLVDDILKEDPHEHEALRVHANLLLRTGQTKNLDQAESEFVGLTKQTPNDASAWFGLGEAKRLKGDLEGAKAQYLQALGKQPNYLAPRYPLAEIGLMDGRPQEALQQSNEILKARPDDTRGRLLHARSLLATGNLPAARDELKALAKASSHDPDVELELGLLALSERKYAEARSTFAKMESAGDPRAIVGLSETYLMEKQFETAFQILQQSMKKTPDSPLIQEQFAKAAALSGRYALAVTEYERLVSTDPKSVSKRLHLADVYGLKGDSAQAITAYKQAEQLSPGNVQVEIALAEAFAKAGHSGEARAQYEKIIQSHPDDAGVLNNAAVFLSETGVDLDEALRFAQLALAKVPGQPSFSDTIGYIYLKKGQRDSAIRTFSNLARKYPAFPTFRYHLGLALLENGDKAGAKRELQAALANHPAQQDLERIKQLLDKIS
jgi:tetratricopeptide (TPR) repeat protein